MQLPAPLWILYFPELCIAQSSVFTVCLHWANIEIIMLVGDDKESHFLLSVTLLQIILLNNEEMQLISELKVGLA